ncbi:MAG: hypothetical protein ACTS43_01050 [Candidatus Hodgkinia cicadicola]
MDINLSFLHFERHSHSVRWFTSFSVFVISLKNYVPLKLATLPFLIIIGDPLGIPKRSQSSSNRLRPRRPSD